MVWREESQEGGRYPVKSEGLWQTLYTLSSMIYYPYGSTIDFDFALNILSDEVTVPIMDHET